MRCLICIFMTFKMTSMFYMIEELTAVNKAIKNNMSCTPSKQSF